MDRRSDSLSNLVNNTGTLIKFGLAIITLIGVLTAFYVRTQSLITLPEKFAVHDSVTASAFRSMDKLLCLSVADHRKLDWRLCFISPSEVVPAIDRVK